MKRLFLFFLSLVLLLGGIPEAVAADNPDFSALCGIPPVGWSLPAGTHTVTWNATDQHGSPVAGGVYLVWFAAGQYQQTRKIVLLK